MKTTGKGTFQINLILYKIGENCHKSLTRKGCLACHNEKKYICGPSLQNNNFFNIYRFVFGLLRTTE